MILNYSWAVWLAWTLAAYLVASGLVDLAAARLTQDGFLGGSFPRALRLAKGFCETATGALIAWYPTRPLGLLVSLLLCVAFGFAVARKRGGRHIWPPLAVFVATLLTAWGLRLI